MPSLAPALQFDRSAIAAGQLWRLFTGHWVHYSFDHALWDVVVFLCLGLACERESRRRFVTCVATSAVAISSAVWLWLPEMDAYRGLSGVDSALFVLLVADVWRDGVRSRRFDQVVLAAACCAAFLLKISFELVTGSNVFVKSLEAGVRAVPLAHMVGATAGLLVGVGTRRADLSAPGMGRAAEASPEERLGAVQAMLGYLPSLVRTSADLSAAPGWRP